MVESGPVEATVGVATHLGVLLLGVTLAGCATTGTARVCSSESLSPVDRAQALHLLTYNVAGLPDAFSGSHPSVNHPIISAKLDDFDVVLVQEDFWYHDELSSLVTHAYASRPGLRGAFGVGDGLNRWADACFDGFGRTTWLHSHGILRHANDSLAPKGFSVATHHLGGNVAVDIYNVHLDAGSARGDARARAWQVDQLLRAVRSRSPARAVIVAGDWNLDYSQPEDRQLLVRFTRSLGLRDAADALGIEDSRIDRVLYRSGDDVRIMVSSYRVERERFRDAAGWPLSDHDAVAVRLLVGPASSR